MSTVCDKVTDFLFFFSLKTTWLDRHHTDTTHLTVLSIWLPLISTEDPEGSTFTSSQPF